MEFARIVGLFVLAAVVYGLVHDQITARVCLEYFTIGHVRMFASGSPTLHALYWGVAATWWAGLSVGLLVAGASRTGRLPKLAARQQAWPAVTLMAAMAVCATVAGVHAYFAVQRTPGSYVEMYPVVQVLPFEKWPGFCADADAHLTSYGVGFFGGVVIAVWSVVRRVHHRRRTPASIGADAGV